MPIIVRNLSCKTGPAGTSIVFGNKNAYVTNGIENLAEIMFSSVHIPVDKYMQLHVEIPAASGTEIAYKIDVTGLALGETENLKAIAIVPDYTKDYTPTETKEGRKYENQWLYWCFSSDIDNEGLLDVPTGGWRIIGSVMFLSGTEGKYLDTIYVKNTHAFKVPLRILVGK